MRVIPLGITRINWDAFISEIKEKCGRAPTKSLDDQSIDITGLLAFPLVLDLDDPVNYSSLDDSSRLDHMFMTFLILHHKPVVSHVARISDLYQFECHRMTNDDEYITIISGTVTQWRAAVYNALKQDDDIGGMFKTIYTLISNNIKAYQLWHGRWKI